MRTTASRTTRNCQFFCEIWNYCFHLICTLTLCSAVKKIHKTKQFERVKVGFSQAPQFFLHPHFTSAVSSRWSAEYINMPNMSCFCVYFYSVIVFFLWVSNWEASYDCQQHKNLTSRPDTKDREPHLSQPLSIYVCVRVCVWSCVCVCACLTAHGSCLIIVGHIPCWKTKEVKLIWSLLCVSNIFPDCVCERTRTGARQWWIGV